MITAEQIRCCLRRLAVAIEKAGPDGVGYLPIFERLERELADAKRVEAALERALQWTKKIGPVPRGIGHNDRWGGG